MVGIIAEYNPFHNGHLYHLNKVKELFPNEVITLVLAGNFLNRGDLSVVNKWDKTKIALEYGIDLVIEMPFIFATQAADIYAYGAINILDNLKCDYLVFGSESNDIDKLINLADIQLNNKEYNENILKYMNQGFNYPTSLAKSLKEVCGVEINTPNDLLGVSYIKEIKKLNSKIKPITIKRTNDYHSTTLDSEITSATSIRLALKDNKDIKKFVPDRVPNYIQNISLNDLFLVLKHQIIIDDLTKYQDVDIKLNNSLKKHISSCYDLDELINKVKTKNYTYNKIKRCLVHILVGLPKKNYKLEYIRILGFNKKGQEYLNKIKKEVKLPLITNYNKLLDIELRATKVYSLVAKDIVKDELNKPIMF